MWTKLTEEKIFANLSRNEVEAYREDFEVDVIQAIIADTVELIRGSIESGRKCRLSPEAGTIPPMLISPAADYATFVLLKRIDIVPNDARTKAYENANSLFNKIASGQVIPPDGVNVEPEAPVRDPARPAITRKHRVLGRHQEEGI